MKWKKADSEYKSQSTGPDDRIASLFQPDTLLSSQYFDNMHRRTVLDPEKKLILAILEDAVDCFKENHVAEGGRRKMLFDDAEQWIRADGGDWVFSFDHICEALGLSPAYVRQGLLRWQEKNRSNHVKGRNWEVKKRMAG
ncbi:MAG: hypothetical protein WCH75_08730 [Candidatus Binatia bacterium]|jgi:hypothetical protein